MNLQGDSPSEPEAELREKYDAGRMPRALIHSSTRPTWELWAVRPCSTQAAGGAGGSSIGPRRCAHEGLIGWCGGEHQKRSAAMHDT